MFLLRHVMEYAIYIMSSYLFGSTNIRLIKLEIFRHLTKSLGNFLGFSHNMLHVTYIRAKV